MRKIEPRDATFRQRVDSALDQGGTARPGLFTNAESNCSNPVYREITYGRKPVGIALDGQSLIRQEMWVRCRKCPNCLDARRRRWTHRIRAELAEADRTWFGTFTQS